MINPLRGMKDTIFQESQKFQHILSVASNIAKNYGYSYIQTPLLEETALFKRSVGESSDIVGKEMYQFIDKGGNDVCLRPEGTAGIVRAFISNKLDKQDGVFRFFYHGAMFRYERPQKGRLRSFHQFGCESFGEASVYEDFSTICMIRDIFNMLEINFNIKLNSLGCKECMPPYREKLVSFLENIKDELCEDCNRRITTNPIRVLDCKNTKCQNLLRSSPKLIDNLCQSCSSDFELLTNLLEKNSINYEIDTNLVRGLDYYNKTAFEFISSDIGSQSAIAGGGRYDKLVEYLDGKPTPAIGFALGIERIMDLVHLPTNEREGIYLGALDDEAIETLVSIAATKRVSEKITISYKPKTLKSHLKAADKANAKVVGIIGENESKTKTIWTKDLETKNEQHLSWDEF